MAKRVTIMLDDDLIKKLRVIQVKKILKENRSISFSKIINKVLAKQLRK